jgi:succinate dehydrogenase hydrophobic anchor subunit
VYGLFVTAAAFHGAIGLRQIAREALQWRGMTVNVAASTFCLGILCLGYQAVGALV